MSDDNNPYASAGGNPYGGQTTTGYSGGVSGSGGMASNPVAGGAPAQAPAAPGVVKDITTQSFMSDVIEPSKQQPVVVDFWAPWCGPCKTLGPIIERVASQTKGVTLCKMDVEKYPELSQQMGIQSIPAVVAFIDGRPADAFMGAKSEKEVKAFFDKLAAKSPANLNSPIAEAMEQAAEMATNGDHGAAAELYGAVLGQEPGNLDALAGLGQCYVAVGEIEQAEQLIQSVPEDHQAEGPMPGLIKAVALAKQAQELGDMGELAAAVEKEPKNHQARFDYAVALNAAGNREEATEQLVAIVRADRKWNDDGAKAKLLEFFEAWGNTDPATMAGRRALSAVLFS